MVFLLSGAYGLVHVTYLESDLHIYLTLFIINGGLVSQEDRALPLEFTLPLFLGSLSARQIRIAIAMPLLKKGMGSG